MSRTSFENYGKKAATRLPQTIANGRYPSQAASEKNIFFAV